MNRYEYVLNAAHAPQEEPLVNLARAFAEAVEQNIALDADPTNDPSVLILGAYIAFRTHADVNTRGGYHKLLSMCEQKLINGAELQ
jgi:nitrate reductase alpha subunit